MIITMFDYQLNIRLKPSKVLFVCKLAVVLGATFMLIGTLSLVLFISFFIVLKPYAWYLITLGLLIVVLAEFIAYYFVRQYNKAVGKNE